MLEKKWPLHGWAGVVLILVFWYLNWSLTGLRTQWGFFPLWLGYCLTVDAVVFYRKGTSMLRRNGWAYIRLFVISAPAWWLFELLNLRLKNWVYDGREFFTNTEYALLASLSFSTVIPAVFGTAELVGSFSWINRFGSGSRIPSGDDSPGGFYKAGWWVLALVMLLPGIFFPLVWIALFFILDPLNARSGRPSLLLQTAQGDWRTVMSLGTGAMSCGFFWEMWNYWSYPKWIYDLPIGDFWHIFEMPVLGYTGYFPFALELYAIYHLAECVLKLKKYPGFLNFRAETTKNT